MSAALKGVAVILPVEEDFYVVAATSPADEHTRVLKHGDTFAVFDHYGDIEPVGLREQGIYYEGTRFLSRYSFRLEGQRPLFLSSTVKEDNALLTVDLTNADLAEDGQVVIPRGTVHIARRRFLWQGTCYEQLCLRNYSLTAVQFDFSLHFQADFADIFEVRGLRRERRGMRYEPVVEDGQVLLGYLGLDGVARRTRLTCTPAPADTSPAALHFTVTLEPQAEVNYELNVACEIGSESIQMLPFSEALAAATQALHAAQAQDCDIFTSNEQFNDWLKRSYVDLHMMVTDTAQGPYPYAGVPWFSTAFGRDGIITALEFLWVNPAIARGVLAYLAATQASEVIPEQDAEPGKILHETRRGEMAALGEVPFGRYYGSVDATPLFVLLAGAYYQRTGDQAFIEAIWPNIERALTWIDTYGDRDGDGFVEYARMTPHGLAQQGWKDSHDSVFYADGRLAEPPIALCEVQGYVFAAKRYAAQLAVVLDQTERAEQLARQAAKLQARFEEAFWCEELGTYALALDGDKQACRVRSSNAGHCLFTGIASPEHAQCLAETLLLEDSFSGWGIRTLATSEVRYNPMSYHNGSVWPHDNALIAQGLADYGFREQVLRVLNSLFDASLFVDLNRLPELYCGFPRLAGQGPILYPVACSPQSWAAGAVFMLLQACLGLTIDGPQALIRLTNPQLPESLERVRLTKLRVGDATVDLLLQRHEGGVTVSVLRKQGRVAIVTVK